MEPDERLLGAAEMILGHPVGCLVVVDADGGCVVLSRLDPNEVVEVMQLGAVQVGAARDAMVAQGLL